MKTTIACLLIVSLFLTSVPYTHSITEKTKGKLGLVAMLSGIAALTRYLVKRDIRANQKLRAELGDPDRTIEFERGFDHWRVEWHGDSRYQFRNNVLYKILQRQSESNE
ncbi:MAG: hypothetical protein OXN17_16125 [Candidatus Poribacteria bacterium]|nr:hypothetical protein [Candidatus Poribacteria bacterium]MDE0504584.1 hypothetical protein [Candidatus Poribacteria bacterium]